MTVVGARSSVTYATFMPTQWIGGDEDDHRTSKESLHRAHKEERRHGSRVHAAGNCRRVNIDAENVHWRAHRRDPRRDHRGVLRALVHRGTGQQGADPSARLAITHVRTVPHRVNCHRVHPDRTHRATARSAREHGLGDVPRTPGRSRPEIPAHRGES